MFAIPCSGIGMFANCLHYPLQRVCKGFAIFILHPSIYKCRKISTKHDHNRFDIEILDEFDHGSSPTVISGVISP